MMDPATGVSLADRLPSGACYSAKRWLTFSGHTDPQAAWDACPRGDWLIWLVCKWTDIGAPGSPERRKLASCAADCAELLLADWVAIYPDDDRPQLAIAAARNGDPADAAYAAAYAAAADAAYAAAADAAYAGGAAIVRRHYPTVPAPPADPLASAPPPVAEQAPAGP